MPNNFDFDNPLAPLCKAWLEKIRLATDQKRRRFQDDADECYNFYNGPHEFIFKPKYASGSKGFALSNEEDMPDPTFNMTLNRVAEFVQLFGPVLYHKNPNREVTPRKVPMPPPALFSDPNNPMLQVAFMQEAQQVTMERAVDKARASLLEFYLNWTPNELDLKTESRKAIDEALIKGMGLLWTESVQQDATQIKMVGSFYDSVDFLVIDPDLESRKDAMWIARKRCRPVWEVEDIYHHERGSLKGNVQSIDYQAATVADEDANYMSQRGLSNDMMLYYEVYSKMGIGDLLSGEAGKWYQTQAISQTLGQFGKYCYMVVANNVPFPLNLPPALINTNPMEMPGVEQAIFQALEWPIPFWAESADAWPFTEIVFHEVPRSVWPMGHFKPALGEMKFLNWAYSFLASKMRTTSRDFIVVAKSAAEEIKSAMQGGRDLTILEITGEEHDIKNVVQFLQHPEFNGDLFKVIQAVEANLEKRTGLTELVYGMTTKQMRSAHEAEMKSAQMNVRPDDMATRVEEAMTEVSRKEAIAARLIVQPQDVLPIMGEVGAQMWAHFVTPAPLEEVVHQLDYRIEAGSTRKPNKERDAQNMNEAMQVLFGPMMNYATQTGDFTAVNALIADWAKAIDLDADAYQFKPPASFMQGLAAGHVGAPPPGAPAPVGVPPGGAPGPAPKPNGQAPRRPPQPQAAGR